MKHLSYADKSVFVDDETADALVEYAGLLANTAAGDSVTLRAIGPDGNEVEVSFVLNAATSLVAETTNSMAEPPSNEDALAYLREKIRLLQDPPAVHMIDAADVPEFPEGEDREL